LVSIDLVLSEEKIFEKVYDVRRQLTPSDGNSFGSGELKTLNWILFVVDHLNNSVHVKNVDLLQNIVLTPNQNAIALIPELCLLSQSI
jgi:hypothetical protein